MGRTSDETEVSRPTFPDTQTVTAYAVTILEGPDRGKSFEKFPVPPPGNIRVVARLDPDREFDASLESAELLLYDRVSRHTGRVVSGVALLMVGGLGVLVGAMLLIFAALRG